MALDADEGLWSLDDYYRVLVATKRFDEWGAKPLLLSLKANTRILLPADPHYWPAKAPLGWHRKHHGLEAIQGIILDAEAANNRASDLLPLL